MREEKELSDDRRNRSKQLKNVLAKMIEEAGFECVGVDLSTSGSGSVLRVYIDTPDGVRHEDCERVSRLVADYLDTCDEEGRAWFAEHYFVEVSSPGIERPLFTIGHYHRFVGRLACVSLKNRRKITGVIASVDDEKGVELVSKDGRTAETVPFGDIKRGNLVFVLEKGEKKSGSKKHKK
jgi:ribosome maturation factor RimP